MSKPLPDTCVKANQQNKLCTSREECPCEHKVSQCNMVGFSEPKFACLTQEYTVPQNVYTTLNRGAHAQILSKPSEK